MQDEEKKWATNILDKPMFSFWMYPWESPQDIEVLVPQLLRKVNLFLHGGRTWNDIVHDPLPQWDDAEVDTPLWRFLWRLVNFVLALAEASRALNAVRGRHTVCVLCQLHA